MSVDELCALVRGCVAFADRLADAKLRVESARLLLHRACWALDAGQGSALFTALSKLATSEGLLATAGDALGGTLFSGTSDIQRELIALELTQR